MKIIFTGGGTAGHAMVNTVLIPYLQQKECRVAYIGSKSGIEKIMVGNLDNVPYYGINAGKLRRYMSLKNLRDIFLLAKGITEALHILKKENPQLVYSSGGYVSVPVVWAAYMLKIPVVLRETDYTTGLANKLCIPFAKEIYVTFPDSQKKIKNINPLDDGMIIRPQLFDVNRLSTTFINLKKPVCLVIGGSSGATSINNMIWNNLDIITKSYSVIHICGSGKYNPNIADTESYQQLEFVQDIGVFYNIADVVITRSGSNATIEGLLLGKRMVCIPLSNSVSRGEQMLNAKFAEKNGTAVIIQDKECNISNVLQAIKFVLDKEINSSYKIAKPELVRRIENHVDRIYYIALKQLYNDINKYLRHGTKINVEDLSMWEIDILDELTPNYYL